MALVPYFKTIYKVELKRIKKKEEKTRRGLAERDFSPRTD